MTQGYREGKQIIKDLKEEKNKCVDVNGLVIPVSLKKGVIVQIVNDLHHWFPSLVVVSEVKSFGIQGYVFIPKNSKEETGTAYIRLNTEDFELVGNAIILAR